MAYGTLLNLKLQLLKTLQNVLNNPCTAGLLIAHFNSYAVSCFHAFAISFVYTRKEIGGIQIRFLSFQLTNVIRSLCSFIFNPLKTERRLFYLKTQFVPRSKHFISVIKTNKFML